MKISKTLIVVGLLVTAAVLAWLFLYQSGMITAPAALEKIRALPEVQEFIAELEKNDKTPSFNVENRDGYWSVQVYEIVVRGGESHTATFNWYRVNKTTGVVSKEFE